ncbi:MAG: hypothetical protein ABJA67_17470 [Chthonomonadales bacterium]
MRLQLQTIVVTCCMIPTCAITFAQNPSQILEQVNSQYRASKSFQATYHCEILMGRGIEANQFKVWISGGKFRMESTKGGATKPSSIVVDDGKRSIIYSQATNKYLEGPHSKDPMPFLRVYGILVGGLQTRGGVQYSSQPDQKLNGFQTYRLHGTSERDKTNSVDLWIDRVNHVVRQVQMGAPGMPGSVKTSLISFAFDRPIDAKMFVFNPPKGSTAMGNRAAK